MQNNLTKENIINFLVGCNENTKIYLGCDSEKVFKNKKWYVDYMVCVVVHINGNNGGRIFGRVERDISWENNNKKPKLRLLNEAIKISEVYLEFEDIFSQFECEIHLDINPNKKCLSSVALSEAVGYIRGICMLEPKVKPEAWAASTAADRFKSIHLCC